MNTVFYASYFLLDKSPKIIRNVACSQQEQKVKKGVKDVVQLAGH